MNGTVPANAVREASAGDSMESFAGMLKEHSLKATFQRMTILSTIHRMGHSDVDEIYGSVREIHPTISLATVYKNILTMVEHDVLTEVPIAGKKSKFELKKRDHIHLVCTECGMVTDRRLDDTIMNDTVGIAVESSFTLRSRQINLYGVCEECTGKESR
jgi:Fur family ferric uptake transcriptional regulator/Fur family peroxide stress response transcriptional regulator